VWVSQRELVRANLTAAVQFTPVSGGPVHKAEVRSGLSAVGPDGNPEGEGRVYTFSPTGSGVGLYPTAKLSTVG
jgi:hypothetical protein